MRLVFALPVIPILVEEIFGTPGVLDTDAATQVDTKFTVLVNSDTYQLALDQKLKWEQDGTYKAFWQNCVSHVADIAKAVGLDTSSGSWVTPQDYVRDISSRNDLLPGGEARNDNGQDSSIFPREAGSPTLSQKTTEIQKLEYGLQLVDWAGAKHPVVSFKQQAPAGQLDPFEWQMVEALKEINSIPDAETLGADPLQTVYWGHIFFQNIVEEQDHRAALQQLESALTQSQKDMIAGSKEIVRAAVAQQLSNYLDRGDPRQTLRQLSDRLRNSNDPIYIGAPSNARNAAAELNEAIQRGETQRAQSIRFKNADLDQSAYRRAMQALQQKIIEYNKMKADNQNLKGRTTGLLATLANPPAEQTFFGFLRPEFRGMPW